MQIIELTEQQYKAYPLIYSYDTSLFYQAEVEKTREGFSMHIKEKGMERTHRHFVRTLYQEESCSAYALINNEGRMCAFIEVKKEGNAPVLKLSNMLVLEGFRRRGYGTLLMMKAKTLLRFYACTALKVQFEQNNVGAGRFFSQHGFVLSGFDISSDYDAENECFFDRVTFCYHM